MTESTLAEARAAFERHDWPTAYEILHDADAASPLEPADLELLGEAARWSSHFDVSLDTLERAEGAYSRAGDTRSAARMALALCRDASQRRDDAVMMGWYARATRHLEGDEDCPEYWLLQAYTAIGLLNLGQTESAAELALRVSDYGRTVGNRELEAFGKMFHGHALIHSGDPSRGRSMIDEAMAAAMSGELGLSATGQIYCSTIYACRSQGDWRRAGEWTEALGRWCKREHVTGFPGVCRVHRAEVMRFHGRLDDAEREALAAVDELLLSSARAFAGWAFHEIGDVRRRRGDLRGATDAFGRAAEVGSDPQPGQALLRLREGDVAGARAAIDRALSDAAERENRLVLLDAKVTIALAGDDLDGARAATTELEEMSNRLDLEAIHATATSAAGRLAIAEGRSAEAVEHLRRALRIWADLDAPYELAEAHLQLAVAFDLQGDRSSAASEAAAAYATFTRLGCALDAAQAAAKLDAPAPSTIRTFLFSDIVDSTKLASAIGDNAWHQLLSWHDLTLRSIFEREGGTIVKHEGDGFFVAFPDGRNAIDAAITVQRQLAGHRRDHGFAPRVRIGLHTAEATPRGNDFVGLGVHAAARIASAARADEVLASREVLDAAGPRVRVVDERELELKGFGATVTVATVPWDT